MGRKPRKDWVESVNWSLARDNVDVDAKGDWYRDPWGWPENEYVLDKNPAILLGRARSSGAKRAFRIDVPKYNFATRPAVVLDPIDRLVLQGITDFIAPKLMAGLSPWVYGWRATRREKIEPGKYLSNRNEWKRYRGHLQRLVSGSSIGLCTDIVSCFASIPLDRVSEDIERKAGKNEVTTRLLDMLKYYDEMPSRRGIPQRSFASCVIANMYLGRLDPVLDDFSRSRERGKRSVRLRLAGGGPYVTRWMDDIWAFGKNEGSLRALQFDLQNEAREIGLELHAAKTEVLEGDQLAERALRLDHSAVDEALDEEPVDIVPLEELVDRLLVDPANAERSSIRFAMTRMRQNQVKSRLANLIDESHRMPQGADHLARAYREFNLWEDLQEWFLEYEQSNFAKLSWAASQFGTMFPTDAKVDEALSTRFLEILSVRPPLPMLALTAQRSASWRPDEAKDCLRNLSDVADHPLERRVVALASLAVGEDRSRVRRMLSEYEENRVTLDTIEDRDYRPLSPVPDFASD